MMETYLRYDAEKPSHDKVIMDLNKAMGGLARRGLVLKYTLHRDFVPPGEKAEVELKGTLEQVAGGLIFHALDDVLSISCFPAEVVLNPKVEKVEMFFD